MTPIREEAKENIAARIRDGIANLHLQFRMAVAEGDDEKAERLRRRIAERERFLERIQAQEEAVSWLNNLP